MPDEIIQAMTGTELKYCPRCKTLKPLSEFHKSKASKDGCQPICKKCRHEADVERNKMLNERKLAAKEINNTDNQISVNQTEEKMEKKEVIKTTDGRTLVKKEDSGLKPLERYTPRELLTELKRRGYIWKEMYVKQTVEWDKI